MKNLMNNGFTIYIGNNGTDLNGCGLKNLGAGRGIQPVELSENEFCILNEFPSTLQLLNEGNMMQMYRGDYVGKIYPYYIAQIGTTGGEGPYGEEDCFSIVAEGAGSEFCDALMSLEEQCRKLEDCSHKLPIKKAYRLYGDSRYKVYKR